MADEILNNINEETALPEFSADLPEMQDTPEIEEIINPEPPAPPLTSIDKMNKISMETFATEAPKLDFDYQMGKTQEFSAKRANFDKYYSYGSDIYGKYGFNPFLPGVDTDGDGKLDKSGMDNLYDENTSDWEDIKRAYRGMMELRQIGLQDTFLFGMFHDDENYKSFGDTMKKYSSSKGGGTGFWSNTMLSAGYTVGIIEAIAYEEALLALTTWGAGNVGTSAAMATRLGKNLQKAGKWLNKNKIFKVVDDLQDVGKVKSWLGRRKQAFAKGTKSFLRTVSPVGETVDFIRNADRLSEFTKLQAVATGAASVSRDMRKIYLAHSEGKLEANMAEEEFRDKAWDEWYKMNPNAGPIPKEQLNLINAEAARVNANVYAGNFGLIYLTNAVTFNNLFRSGKSVRRLFNHSANGLFKITRDATTKKALVQAVGKGAKQYIRNKVKDWTIAGTVKKGTLGTLRSSMEGVQEVGQDILSESFKNYHIRNTLGTQTEGGFLHYLENDLVHAIKRQNSQQGLETFLSGMFMGVFASPVTFANQQLTKFVDGSGFITAKGTYDKTFNKEKYKQTQKQEQKKLEEEAERLTKFFNENKTFIKMTSQPIYRQVELQQDMLDAAEKGHMRDFKNSHHASIVNGARTLLEKGMVDDYIEQLEYFASENYTTEDLRELFERPDITDETAPEFRDKLLQSAEILKNLKESYSIIQAALPNPHSVKRLKPGDPLFMETLIKHQAWKDLQTELLFNSSKIADRKQRLESIKKLINDTNPLSAEFTVEALVDETQLEQAVKLLRAEVNANKDLDLTGEASLNALTTEKRLAALEAYQDAILAFKVQAEMSAGIGFVKSESEYYDDMFEAYNKLLEAYGKNTLLNRAAQREINQQSFDLIFDYINLELSTGEFTKYVQTLETTAGRESFLKTREQVLKRLDDNKKEHIKNALQAFYEKRETDQMLKELYDLGFFFELTHLDDLMRKGIMPIEILDLNNNNQPVTDEQYMMAQEVMQKYVSKLIGKKLIRDKFEAKSRGRKLKSDERTVDEIIKEYNISLNKNIDITKKEGQLLLEKVLDPSNKNLTKVDREILVKVITDNSAVLKFVTDQTLPIQINDAGVITIDIRYAGEDYVNSAYSIENLIITALTQNKFINQLKENDDLWLQARMAMRQAKDVYQKNYPDENVDEMPVFNDVNIFLSESLNDLGFQKFLAQIEDNVAPAKKSLWSTVKKGSEAILEKEFAGKLLNRVINIASKAVDDSIVDNISEINIKARTDENEEALNKKVEELKVMAEEMSMKWNVKVKVLKDQNEAREFLDKIENPFYSKEEDVPAGFYDEKTNTAYIIAEDVKANTLYHEIFLHPFLINAEKNNSELYKALVDEARADQTVIDYVEKEYGKESIIGTRQFEHELVGRVYELALANKISEKEKPGLFKRIYEFAKLMLRKTGEFLKILPKDVSKFNPTKTKIKDLAEFSRSQRTGMDLGKVITEPFRPKKKKEKSVSVKKKIKKEEQVNVGGNTVVIKEARDQPGLMKDFIRDDIQFENAESIKTATDEIVELGKELDNIDVLADESNWKFGELRLQIDGRLVIDVIANGKRFLMYKSIGKGSTAETKGEWTPLLYFGTKLDKNQNPKEWFVKALFEGKDPKINKYGSKTFIGLDTILKARESELFTGAEEFKTVTYTEEIEVEETPVETKTEKAKEDSEIQLEEDDTLESIVNKIDNIQAQIDEQKKLQESGKLTMREKGRVKRKILRLSIFLNELERERRKKIKEQETTESKLQVKEEDTEFVAELDYNGNEIITPEMPYSRLPESLQLALAEQYGKKRQLLTQEDVDNINKERKTNPVYISIVNEYVEKRLERQNKILGEQEVKINQEKINRAKAKRRAEEEARRKGKKVKLTLEEKIKELAASLKTVSDKPLLTDKEIKDLANKIRNQESLVPFTLADVNNILIDKVRKIELKNKQKDVRKYAEYIAEKRKREKTIKENVKRLGKSGSVSAPIFKGLDKQGEKQYKRNDLVIPAGMRQFLLKYHPDLFLEETLDVFNEKLSTIMKQYRLDRGPGMTLSQPELEDILKGTPEEIQKGISELLSSLEEKKKAYPVIIKRINAALNEANIPYTIKMLSGSKLANSSSLYEFKFTPNKVKGKNVFSPKKGKFTADQAVIDNFKINEEDVESGFITPEEAARIELAKILLSPGVFLPRGLFENLDSKGTREGLYDSWISEDKETWPLNIGANVTVAGLGDKLFESLTSYFNLDQNEIAQLAAGKYEYSPVTSVVYELLRDNFTKKALRKAIASEIRDKIQIEEQEELIIPEDLRSFIEYIEWSTSEEGKAIVEQELALKAQDIIAFEELYLQEQIAEIQEEERIKKEGNVVYTYFQKDIADQLAKTDKVNEQLTILWDLLNKDLQGDIAFIKSVRNYTKDLNMTNKQKEVNEALLVAQFSGGPLLGKVIQIMNKAYIIQDYVEESNKVELVELDAEQSMRKNLLEVNEVLELAVQELKPGTIFNGKIIDTVANSAEIKYIKDAYSDILTNFTSYTKEAESLSDEKLLEDLKTELRKCK